MTLLAATLAVFRPWEFPTDTIPHQVRRGIATFVSGKGLDRIYAEDQVSVGSWSPGFGRIDIEEVLWLSPNLLSRWLGYLEAKEKWPDGEREARWDELRGTLSGRAVLVVRLCAFPRKGGLIADDEPANMASLRPLHWMITVDGTTIPAAKPTHMLDRAPGDWPSELRTSRTADWSRVMPKLEVRPLGRRRSEGYTQLLRTPWVAWTPFASLLGGIHDLPQPGYVSNFGDYLAEWHWVEADFRDGMRPTEQFELRILSQRRERIAVFPIHFSPAMKRSSPKARAKG